ncbi:MAG: reactive intermediate/imine deaminase [Nitrospinae bacterium]|jgi:2-iminobutanoate/2-iminopropanoate deaminase|nr:reactive intermediate/imine deaminase [Nitrospinota bacterium]
MKKRIIQTDQAPAAIGPYSQAVRVGNFLYTSGQIALDPQSGEFLSGEIEQETERTIENISAILKAGGLSLDNVIKTTVYLTDLSHFARMNHIYEKYFSGNKPARACVQVAALPKGAKVEIEAIAIAAS